MDSEHALASGDRRGERASLLASRSTRESVEEGQPGEGVTMREDEDGSVYGWRRAVGTRAGRVRALGVAFTLMCAILGLSLIHI